MSDTCDRSHIPDSCWTCQLERSNRDLNDENKRLRQEIREADEQCYRQVADAVKTREEALQRVERLERECLRLVMEMDELRQNIHDQAEIIERYEAL